MTAVQNSVTVELLAIVDANVDVSKLDGLTGTVTIDGTQVGIRLAALHLDRLPSNRLVGILDGRRVSIRLMVEGSIR